MGNSTPSESSRRRSKATDRDSDAGSSRTKRKKPVHLPLELDYPDHVVPGSMSGQADYARKALDALPELTEEQLLELKQRIDQGYYKDPEVVAAMSKQIAIILFDDQDPK